MISFFFIYTIRLFLVAFLTNLLAIAISFFYSLASSMKSLMAIKTWKPQCVKQCASIGLDLRSFSLALFVATLAETLASKSSIT